MRDHETMLQKDLDQIADQLEPRAGWQGDLLDALDDARSTAARRRLHVTSAAMVVVVLLVVGVGVVVRLGGHVEPEPARLPDSRSVDIGGRSLFLDCRGQAQGDDETVVVDRSIGGSAEAWEAVVAQLATSTRVCLYDRAGVGRSDAPPRAPRTAADLAADLRELIATADLGPRVVLVADGAAAYTATELADLDPTLLSGLVLLDPRGVNVTIDRTTALGDKVTGEPRSVTQQRADLASDEASRNGEQISLPASEAEAAETLTAAGPGFGDVPVIVLWPALGRERLPTLPSPLRERWWSTWRAGQDLYAAESARGEVREVAGTSGSLSSTAPASVADAVLGILSAD
ncbi:alpha/beta fold hydrolase [Nocardioides zhouii]|uniref:AB hydrolase-1 domain-containing protein n=1 Tax=Nocardioides zhouii TaxID=1168729 RepID=A0A4Q2SJH0_9ACTN|nr:alpha/beta fold hydrolase [Nocardioides zhouii]RYC04154.1 hypothetical protein EUA94_20745 [Nocardioides zhouii]